jgi:CheY-like chemotaxis protein
VEDHADMRGAVAVMLEREGFQVAEADHGAGALTYLGSGRQVNAIILNLPTISGFTIIRDLEQNPVTRHIPVIVVTGEEPAPELHHALIVMCKPFDPD